MLLLRVLLDEGFAIPDDIALVGSDNLPLGPLVRPRLTSVHPGLIPGIDATAETFHLLIQGQEIDVPALQLLHPWMVIREST